MGSKKGFVADVCKFSNKLYGMIQSFQRLCEGLLNL